MSFCCARRAGVLACSVAASATATAGGIVATGICRRAGVPACRDVSQAEANFFIEKNLPLSNLKPDRTTIHTTNTLLSSISDTCAEFWGKVYQYSKPTSNSPIIQLRIWVLTCVKMPPLGVFSDARAPASIVFCRKAPSSLCRQCFIAQWGWRRFSATTSAVALCACAQDEMHLTSRNSRLFPILRPTKTLILQITLLKN